jgi:hypothetical protein
MREKHAVAQDFRYERKGAWAERNCGCPGEIDIVIVLVSLGVLGVPLKGVLKRSLGG